MKRHIGLAVVASVLCLVGSIAAQTAGGGSAAGSVPPLVQFSGVVNGQRTAGMAGITFSLYAEQEGGSPLWLETQNVQTDKNGNYSVMLGSATSQGLPSSLFASGQARWLGVQVQGQEEQPRIMLLSVPYALKAGDAQTLNGQPASAFLTASRGNAANGNGVNNNAITGGGTTDYVPLWLSKSKLGSSKIFQSAAGHLGIGTTSPAANLDVNGTSDIRNTLTLFPNGSSPTLSINGTAFQVSNTGAVTFVSGQTFPGTATLGANTFNGNQTVNGSVSATQLISNAAQGTAPLQVTSTTQVPNLNASYLGGFAASAFQPAGSYATLGANTFTATQTISSGDLSLGAGNIDLPAGGIMKVGGISFAFGSSANGSSFLGFAGNGSTTASGNTATGYEALVLNGAGTSNTANGAYSLDANTSGSENTAAGYAALTYNAKGNYNTGVGYNAGPDKNSTNLTNATAIGAQAVVSQSNALVLGCTTATNSSCPGTVSVGIGTATPAYTLDVQGSGRFTQPIVFASNQTFPGTGTVTQVNSGAGLTGGPITGSGTLSIATAGVTNAMLQYSSLTVNAGTALTGGGAVSLGGSTTLNVDTTKVPLLNANNSFTGNQTVNGNLLATAVGIGTTSPPASTLDVEGTAAAGSAPVVWLKNDATIQSGAPGNSVDIRFTPDSGGAVGTPNAYIRAQEDGNGSYGTSMQFGTVTYGSGDSSERMRITSTGFVGIGTTVPEYPLDVRGGVPASTYGGSYALNVLGANASSGSGDLGTAGVKATGGTGDPDAAAGGDGLDANGGSGYGGGNGVVATGGLGAFEDGVGGRFTGGDTSFFGDGVDAIAGSGYAGYFSGSVDITGTLSKGGGSFKIDHPLDPANKYLYHSFVESPDMKNVYDGVVTLDANGEAVVDFPDWFSVLNRDFRYQLTCIGGFAPVYIAEKINNNHFKIAGGKPGLEVSWQVTGIRQDAWANAHRIPVEEEKEAKLRGFYIHPELYGAPPEKQIEWARHPQMMQRMKDGRMKQRQANAQSSASAHAEPPGVRAETLPLTEPLVPRHSLAAPSPAQTKPVNGQKPIAPQKPSTQEPAARLAP